MGILATMPTLLMGPQGWASPLPPSLGSPRRALGVPALCGRNRPVFSATRGPCIPHALSAPTSSNVIILDFVVFRYGGHALISDEVQEGRSGMSVLPASWPLSASLVIDKIIIAPAS